MDNLATYVVVTISLIGGGGAVALVYTLIRRLLSALLKYVLPNSAPSTSLAIARSLAGILVLGGFLFQAYVTLLGTASHWARPNSTSPVVIGPSSGELDARIAAVQAEYASLGMGKVLYNPPDEMFVGRREPITVRIYRGPMPNSASPPLLGRGRVQSDSLRVSSSMSVRLDGGDDFDVQSSSPNPQFIPDGGFGNWTFEVKPLREGNKRLFLTASFQLDANHQTELPPFPREIHVAVLPPPPPPPPPSLMEQVGSFLWAIEFWKWLLGLLGTAITGIGGYFLLEWWKARHRRKTSTKHSSIRAEQTHVAPEAGDETHEKSRPPKE